MCLTLHRPAKFIFIKAFFKIVSDFIVFYIAEFKYDFSLTLSPTGFLQSAFPFLVERISLVNLY